MESVGFKLRRARLGQDLTLIDINASTRIPVRILEAIENDQPDRLNGVAFYKSFVRQFADAVGLDYEEIAPAVQAIVAASTPQPLGAVVTTHYAPRSVAIRSFRSGRVHPVLTFASFFVVLAGCSFLYAAWRQSGESLGNVAGSVGSKIGKVVKRAPEASSDQKTAIQKSPVPTAAPAATPHEPSAPAVAKDSRKPGDFLLQLSALERTWLTIVADGKQAFDGILERAETKTLQGNDVARIRTGNAGALSVVFNGKDLGPLGPRGQVRVAVFTKTGYEVLRPPSRASITEILVTGE